jgi:NAD(P)-dependent dehydrogenase (short-subunit alcohol dehydrogenase family)
MTPAKKVWLLIGGGSGIQLALAETLLKRSDHCLVGVTQSSSAIDTICDLAPDRFTSVRTEITDRSSVAEALETAVARFGTVDIVVACASADHFGSVERTSDSDARDVVEVNLFGVLNVAKVAIPYLRQQRRGGFAVITSGSAFFGQPGSGIYSASKAAALALTESLAVEVRPFGIDVTAIAPEREMADAASLEHAAELQLAAEAIVASLTSPEPPTHLVLGQDCIVTVARKLDLLSQLMLDNAHSSGR